MLFGILFTIVIYAILGFLLAWIVNMVAQEEVGVGTGVVILVIAGVINFLLRYFALPPDVVGSLIGAVVNFAVLSGLIHLVTKISLKHSVIVAAIYTAVLFLIGLGFGMLAMGA